jgi:adenine-specific DNA-methyltransferase
VPKRSSGRTGGAKKTTTRPTTRGGANKAVTRAPAADTRGYTHPEATSLLRPDVGVQSSFRKKKPPQTWRYDSSLSPALEWDGQNPAREVGEWLLALVEKAAALAPPHEFAQPEAMEFGGRRLEVRGLRDAVEQLRRLGRPFLNWAGKAERQSFDVPTLPLFVHERLSTTAILETLKGHRRDRQLSLMDLFGDPQHSVAEQVLKAYEHQDNWVNRLVLGDSLVVMNSLLHYEGLGGQVQMIYMDPPYGVKFGSNFQPFVRKRDVKHNDDEDFTREPEMVKAYRDTWELGLHSYLTYMRDRLLLARELLAPTGSVFVQISDENVHHVRELLDEVFGAENACSVIAFVKTSGFSPTLLSNISDYLLWYARDIAQVRFRQPFRSKTVGDEGATQYNWVEALDGSELRPMTAEELANPAGLEETHRILTHGDLSAQGVSGNVEPFPWSGETYRVPRNCHWKTTPEGLQRLAERGRLMALGNTLRYKRYLRDFPVFLVSNVWSDTGISGFADKKLYTVQTNPTVVQRAMLMTTDPGDLVLDPTCGSGTTAYVAEQWGRRWVAIDTSRVPLALARQRLLTATFPYYELQDEKRGPAGGFVYRRKQNSKGEEVGGIVPHVTLKSIANDEPPAEEVLVDRPEALNKITRVTGPFCVEATIPTPVDWDGDGVEDSGVGVETHGSFLDRMLEVLRRSPVLHLGTGRTVTLTNVRPPAKSLSLSAEAMVDDSDFAKAPQLADVVQEARETNDRWLGFSQRPVALVFGPENGAVSERLVFEAAREAYGKSYAHLFVLGFAIQANARALIEACERVVGVAATYVQATPDLMMGDLLKTMRSSQIFSVCGSPEVRLRRIKAEKKDAPARYSVELLGLDVFDPATMETHHRRGDDVPAWLLDSDYNGLCFKVTQAFFPRTSAWDDLRKSLKGEFEDSVWNHLAGTESAPFEAGDHGQVAVKVIDDRGNELLVVKRLDEAEG